MFLNLNFIFVVTQWELMCLFYSLLISNHTFTSVKAERERQLVIQTVEGMHIWLRFLHLISFISFYLMMSVQTLVYNFAVENIVLTAVFV